jgi:hypothetical protein
LRPDRKQIVFGMNISAVAPICSIQAPHARLIVIPHTPDHVVDPQDIPLPLFIAARNCLAFCIFFGQLSGFSKYLFPCFIAADKATARHPPH